MEEITDKEKYAADLAKKAERALKILKITVIITAACAVVLPLISLVLLMTVKNSLYGFIGLIVSLGLFLAMLVVLVCVIFYVRKQVRKLKLLDKKEKNNDE